LIRMGDYSESVKHLEAAIAARPGEPVFHSNLAFALVNLGRTGRALSEYSQVVALDPNNATGHLELGQLLLDFKDFRRARSHLEKAVQLCDECQQALSALGQLYLTSGKPGLAVPLFQALLANDRSSIVRRNLVQAMQQAGKDSLLVDLLSHWPVDQLELDELQLLITAERQCGHVAQALYFLNTRQVAPSSQIPAIIHNSHQFWGEVAYSLLLSQKWDEALRGFELALELDPQNHLYLNNRQVALDRIKERENRR